MASFKDKFKYAFNGLKVAFKDKAILLQMILMCIVIAFAFLFQIKPIEWCIVLLCCILVVSFEFVNSILERILDFIHPEYHDKIKDMKDLCAGAVLFVCMAVAIVGMIVFGPYIINVIRGIINGI